MTAVLNTARRFSAPAFTPILNNLVAIGVLLAFAAVGHTHSLAQVQHDRHLLLLLGIGTTLGVVIQAVALVPSVLACGLRIRPRGDPTTPPCARSSALSGWTFGFVIANQVAVFVVSAIAVSIGAATLTAYTYASTFFQLPFGIVAVSVMTTIAPVLASRFTRGDTAGFAEQFGLGLRRMLAGVHPGRRRLPAPGPARDLAHLARRRERRTTRAGLTSPRPCSSCWLSACPDSASTCSRSSPSSRCATRARPSSSTCWRTG